jgi:H+-transporting ATPase
MAKSNVAHAKSPDAKPASPTDAKDDLKTLPMAEVEKRLGSSPDGLTQAEAATRLTKYGPNEIVETKTNPLLKFLMYFWGPIPWMIEVAVVLSGIVRHWPDFFIILVLLLANAMVGFWEERQAGNAIEALKAKLAITARVRRDGTWSTPPAKALVPGDVIRLRLGDIVPADARLLDGDEVSVDQAALTGESLPVSKNSGDAVFSGSIIRRGEIGALVYATGDKTYFGKTADLVQSAHVVSHFQKAVLRIGNYLIMLAVVLVGIIIVLGIYRGEPILTTLQFALVLTVAAIPVAMPTVLSVTMAVGARLLAKKQAIVSKLVAIEELAGVDVLCADKTGTLTQNKLTLGDPFCIGDTKPENVILAGALASRAEDNDVIDLAVLGGVKDASALQGFDVQHFQPFDPVHKRTEATVKGKDGPAFRVTKGAPQVILALSANAAAVKDAVDKAVNDFAARGFRALGVARADGDADWQLLGILPLFDPPREDAKSTVATARQMGVQLKMVTGDALAIARETAKALDMGSNILDGASLGDSKHEETAEVAKSIEDADGFAQVFPEHKFHIVDVLQKRGHIVGMTGDGVNDAPALKQADCGIAVSGATDAARAAAAIVLMTPGLTVIIDAIKESRKIFQRMNSYAIYRIAETLRVLLFMTLAIVVFNFYPLTAVMIVMLALLNDGAILSIAYDNVKYRNQPEAWNMRVVLGVATVLGLVGPMAAFGLFYIGDKVIGLKHPELQTMMYLMLSVAGHLTIFQTRTRGPWWSTRPAKILLIAVFGTQAFATLIAVYGAWIVTPLGWEMASLVWGYAIVWFLITDPVKLLAYRVLDHFDAKDAPAVGSKQRADAAAVPKDTSPAGSVRADAPTKPVSAAAPQSDKDDKSDAKTAPAPATSQKPPLAAPSEDRSKNGAGQDSAPQPETASKPVSPSAAKPDAVPAAAPVQKGNKDDAKVAPIPATSQKPPEAAPSEEKSKSVAGSDPTQQPEMASKPGSPPAAQPDAVPVAAGQAATPAKVAALLDQKLGEVLLAGLLKNPAEAGHLITDAIAEAEAPATAKAAEAKPTEAASPPLKAAE